MPFAQSNNAEIYFERIGSGYPLFLVAGMASDSASWGPILEALSAKFEIVLLDNRCAGRTRPSPVDTSRRQMAEDVIAVMNACEIDTAHLMGHSMGSLVCWSVASMAPERVSGLVAMSAPFTVDAVRIELFTTLARLRKTENESDWFRLLFQFLFSPAFFANPDKVDEAVAGAIQYPHKQSIAAFAQQSQALPTFLDPVTLPNPLAFPAMAMTGENDKLFSPADLELSYASHPEIALHVIDNAAHSVHWENPQAVTEAVTAFLQ